MPDIDPSLARALIMDELFDLTLYQNLSKQTQGEMRRILLELIPVESGHLDFWKKFFGIQIDRLDFLRRVKLKVLLWTCFLFGENAVHLVLEAIEIYGVKKYLSVWETFGGQPLGDAVRDVLTDEFKHEDTIVLQMAERKIDPAKVRSIFLGFNDGLVEILGAVTGFFAAFNHPSQVLIAASTVAFAGAASMAAGAFVATGSETEIEKVEFGKQKFLGQAPATTPAWENSFHSSVIVGISYLVGASVPVVPLLLGSKTLLTPFLMAGLMILLVSLVLAFLSGMNIKRRILTNLGLVTGAVALSYLVGGLAKTIWGISI